MQYGLSNKCLYSHCDTWRRYTPSICLVVHTYVLYPMDLLGTVSESETKFLFTVRTRANEQIDDHEWAIQNGTRM